MILPALSMVTAKLAATERQSRQLGEVQERYRPVADLDAAISDLQRQRQSLERDVQQGRTAFAVMLRYPSSLMSTR
jgi:hypothetical protein